VGSSPTPGVDEHLERLIDFKSECLVCCGAMEEDMPQENSDLTKGNNDPWSKEAMVRNIQERGIVITDGARLVVEKMDEFGHERPEYDFTVIEVESLAPDRRMGTAVGSALRRGFVSLPARAALLLVENFDLNALEEHRDIIICHQPIQILPISGDSINLRRYWLILRRRNGVPTLGTIRFQGNRGIFDGARLVFLKP
jgi:hypothetical protein